MEKDTVKKLFIKCRTPTKVCTSSVNIVTRCGHCDLCRQAKADDYSMALQREEGSHKWSFFITLTYAPEWIPYYEVVDNCNTHHIYNRVKSLDPFAREKEYFSYDLPLTDVTLYPSFLRRYSKRGVSTYDVCDCRDDYEPINIKSSNFKNELIQYNKHRRLYKEKYSKTNFEHCDGIVAIAPKRDLELFMLRLKNYAYRKCDAATFRYFAVPDYGTNGLSPHWHILLFTDSDKLANEFLTKVIDYGTIKRPSPSAEFIYNLWSYGITNTSRVSKSCASYVASYLNSDGNFPQLLRTVGNLRSYHSSHLGTVLEKKVVYQHLAEKDFGYFENIRYADNEGYVSSYEWKRKDYISFLPTIPYFNRTSLGSYEEVYLYVLKFIHLCRKDYASASLHSVAIALYDSVSSHSPIFMQDYKRIQDYGISYGKDISLFYRLVLSVSAIYKTMVCLAVDFQGYCNILESFEHWYAQRQLSRNFSLLERSDYSVTDIYYSLIASDFSNQLQYSDYYKLFDSSLDRIQKNIKHRSNAELYRFN